MLLEDGNKCFKKVVLYYTNSIYTLIVIRRSLIEICDIDMTLICCYSQTVCLVNMLDFPCLQCYVYLFIY